MTTVRTDAPHTNGHRPARSKVLNLMPENYPRRPSYFANRVTRMAMKDCLAQQIGSTAALLVIFVAQTEDAKRYTAPPTFFNSQLLPILGLRKWEALDKARRDAVSAGWLCYIAPPGGTRQPGTYWSTIPDRLTRMDDAPSDEHNDCNREAYTLNGYGEPTPSPANGYGVGDGGGYGRGYGGGEHSNLYLKPEPAPDKARKRAARSSFVKPTLSEVQSYWTEASLDGDPAEFHDYYEVSGWTQGRASKPMKDWRAAARNWSRRQGQFEQRTGVSVAIPTADHDALERKTRALFDRMNHDER